MSNVPEGYVAIPFIGGQSDEPPKFGRVTGRDTMTLTVYVEAARDIQAATGILPYTLSQAAHVFGLIQRLTGSGFAMSEAELCGLAELCERALDSIAEKEGAAIHKLDGILCSALSYHAKKEADQ